MIFNQNTGRALCSKCKKKGLEEKKTSYSKQIFNVFICYLESCACVSMNITSCVVK